MILISIIGDNRLITDVNLEVGGDKAEGDGYGVDCQRGVRLVMASSYG